LKRQSNNIRVAEASNFRAQNSHRIDLGWSLEEAGPMSALGHKRTYAPHNGMSAISRDPFVCWFSERFIVTN
jgi:hypothetical protein